MTRSIVALLLLLLLARGGNAGSEESCGTCHGSAAAMEALGHPEFIVTMGEAALQTGMPGAGCAACHLGNPGASSAEEAHRGMLTLKVVTPDWAVLARKDMAAADLRDWAGLGPRGKNRATQLSPKVSVQGLLKDNPKFKVTMYHDKNSDTLAFNPRIAEKTCGVCHKGIVQSFLRSPMGGGKGAHTQSQYLSWTGPVGPQS